MAREHLQAWYWVLSQGHVSMEDCQAWAYGMIERMALPPAWICDMATIDKKFDLAQRWRDQLEPWTAEELKSEISDLQVALDYLAHKRGEKAMREVLRVAARRNTQFQGLLGRLEEAAGRGDSIVEIEREAGELLARYHGKAALYHWMRFGPQDEVAQQIEASAV